MEIAQRMDGDKATVLRTLETMQNEGWTERCGIDAIRWRLTPKVVNLSRAADQEILRKNQELAEFTTKYGNRNT
ncbi:MAG: hypothetical protein ORO03_09640 [Alphaproteobacteria bacterium]|nr:hypothetical protein [Alphaproteobacteria bacterium]